MRRISALLLLVVWFALPQASYACSVEPLPWYLGQLEQPQLSLPPGLDMTFVQTDDLSQVRIRNSTQTPLYLAVPMQHDRPDPFMPSLDPGYELAQYVQQDQLWMREYPIDSMEWRKIANSSELEIDVTTNTIYGAGLHISFGKNPSWRREGEELPEPSNFNFLLVYGDQQIALPLQIRYVLNPAYDLPRDPDARGACDDMMQQNDPKPWLIGGTTFGLVAITGIGWWYTRKRKRQSA